MDLLPLSAVDLEKTDEQLGRWLVSTWVGHHALKAGFSLDGIPSDWKDRLIEETGKMDSVSVSNAALESIIRKACAGRMEDAGRMLREYLHRGAANIVDQKYALIGVKQAVGRMKGGEKAGKQRRSDAMEWQSKCAARARLMLEQGVKRRDLAGKLASIYGKTARQIREVLKKAEVK